MKTLKFLFVLCSIFAFSANNANSQKVTGEQIVSYTFSPTDIPCLTETISGTWVEQQSFTNGTYHVQGEGVLIGETSEDEYIMDYNFNAINWKWPGTFEWVFPIRLRHNSKLVAEMFGTMHIVTNNEGVLVLAREVHSLNCK